MLQDSLVNKGGPLRICVGGPKIRRDQDEKKVIIRNHDNGFIDFADAFYCNGLW